MTWQPNAAPAIAVARARMLDRTRDFFRHHGVLEVTTPALGRWTTSDPNIDSFELNVGADKRYLHTSPEHLMKRLLAAGYPDIFQACQVFRRGETGRRHLPEFTMIEWYRHGFGLQQIMDDTIALVNAMLAHREFPVAERISYSAAFEAILGIDPLSVVAADVQDLLDADDALVESLGNDIDAWLDLAMATRIAPAFDPGRLTLVYHYPASQAAMARLCPDNIAVADRFELFCGELELANGFVELTDADIQLQRMETDVQKRAASGLPVHAVDDGLLDALRAGLPDCAGVALGLDRMLMIDEGLTDIRKLTTFTPG